MGDPVMTGVTRALSDFFGGFGIDAYAEGTVKRETQPPYITVQLIAPDWHDTVPFFARVWYRSETFEAINAMVDAIGAAIGAGACVPIYAQEEGQTPARRGALWIYKDSQFAQYMPFEGDTTLKCVYLRMRMQAITEE